MKKRINFVLAVAFAGLALFGASTAFAQGTTPPGPNPDGTGTGPRGYGRGMAGSAEGLLHDYMTTALADAFGLSVQDLDGLHEREDSLWDYAQKAGITADEFQSKMIAAREDALEKAAEDGVISQDHADGMADRMNQFGAGEYGPGVGPCHGGDFEGGRPMPGRRGGRGMGRW